MNEKVNLPMSVMEFSEVALFEMAIRLKLNNASFKKLWDKTNVIHSIRRIKVKKND